MTIWTNAATQTVQIYFGNAWAIESELGDLLDGPTLYEEVNAFINGALEKSNDATACFMRDMIDLDTVNFCQIAHHYNAPIIASWAA